jgi:hypothetical protein
MTDYMKMIYYWTLRRGYKLTIEPSTNANEYYLFMGKNRRFGHTFLITPECWYEVLSSAEPF